MAKLIFFMMLITLSQAQVNFVNVNGSSVFDVKEDAPTGYVIVELQATTTNNESYYFVLENNGLGPFVIIDNKLQLSGQLDYEKAQSYKITISLNYNGFTRNASPTINVVDVVNEDNLPNITVYNGDISLSEERPIGFAVPFNYTVTNLGNRTANYSLLGPASIFMIDQQTGKITLNTTIDADYVPTPQLIYKTVLLVITNDARSSSATFTLTIVDINDNPPRCNELVYYSNVTENTPAPVNLQRLNCTDKDLSPSNRNISYTITHGNTSLFGIDNTGEVYTKDVVDYESVQTETLRIEVQDGGSHVVPTATVIVVVTGVNDNKPMFSTWQPAIPSDRIYHLAENSSLGTTVFTVSARDNDRDVGSDIKYSIYATNNSISIDGIFTIDPVFGGVTLLGNVDADYGTAEYNITVQAGDGTYNDTAVIAIQITDVNDNVPTFVGIPYNVTWPEQNCTTGFVIATITAKDTDISTGNLTIDVLEVANKWQIISTSPTTGQLILKRNLDLDKGDQSAYLIKITVRDGGSPELTGTTSLTLYILPDNEYKPQITEISDLSIPENASLGTILTTLSASDNDTGPEGQLFYTITGGNTGNVFGIDSNNNLRTIDKLDRETLDKYRLTIEVHDSGVDKMTATAFVNITVTNVNEFMPECHTIPMFITLPENTTVNSSVYLYNCTDRDGDSLTYTVQYPENETFAYSSVLQGLQLIKLVDYESPNQLYTVKVDVSDGTLTTHVTLIVQVTPLNEDTPTFFTNATFSISENSKPSNPFLKYTANDTDYSPHNIVKYSIKQDGVIGTLFSIDPVSSEISLLRELDYESLPDGQKFYTLQVIAEDGGGLQGTGTVIVNVLNVNDNAPKCSHEFFLFNVSEIQSGLGPYVLIPPLDCKDAEDGTNLNFTLTQSQGSHFQLLNQSVQLVNNTLDYETATSHVLTVVVSDNGAPPLNTTVVVYVKVINMNDGPPVFPVIPDIPMLESSSIGTLVTVVNATDPDGSDPVFGEPHYSIISGDSSNQFSIGLVSGEITLKKALDFEKQKSYTLVVQAIERGGEKSSTASVNITVVDVNDEVPVCDPNYIFVSVAESETANHFIVAVNCTDGDAGTNLAYSLFDANSTLFQMNGHNLTLKAQLDFETKTFHEFYVNVSDGVFTALVDVFISVRSINEYPPVFETDPYVVNVSEAMNVSSVIQTVYAKDLDSPLDANGIVGYTISDDQHFIIDSKSGQIILAAHLDWKATSKYTLVVTAHDASLSVNASVHVTVIDTNDNPPIFSSTSYSGRINETSTAGTTILTVTAKDDDDPLTNGNGLVTYAIVGNSSYFKINESTGEIQNSRDLDTDVTGQTFFTLNVTARDSFGQPGSLSATALVNIVVTTVNQHQPVFIPDKYSVEVNESRYSYGDVILRVSASDNDTGIDGQFTFDFVSPQEKFSLTQNGSLGEVRLKDILDFDKGDQLFIIEIKVTDKGVPAKFSTATVTIRVDDVNDNPPVCTSIFYLSRVEGSNDTQIVNLHCTDADQNNNLTYSVLGVSPNKTTFEITSSGIVNVKSPLDYEISDFFEVLILVQDDKPLVHNATVIVNLKINDINDNDPSFNGNLSFTVYENETVSGKTLFRANASGNDGPTDVVTYSLLDRSYFDISPTTGEISIKMSAPDADSFISLYTMTVCATDTPNPVPRTVCKNITVTTLDVNDNVPVFNPSIYSAAVKEDVAVGTIITTVTATDKDISPAFSTVYYSIVGGDSDGKFSVDNNGSVRINNTLDFETKTNYSLLIQASDTLNTANVSLNVLVNPVNEFAPEFIATSLSLTVPENTQYNSNYTLNISATDKDHGLDGMIYYSIDPGPFSINLKSGEIKVIGNLDRETQQSYVLFVRAIDKGTPSKTGTLNLTVEVTDVNDNAPFCLSSVYTVFVPEGRRTQSEVITSLQCQDDDKDPANWNNKLSYSIVSGESMFAIDQLGNIMVNANVTVDYEVDKHYELLVLVKDSGPLIQLNCSVKVEVMVTDENDNPPVFKALPNNKVFPEDKDVGSELLIVQAVDADSGNNGLVMYSITKGDSANHFTIDKWNGYLYLTSQLDFENQTRYELEITAQDLGANPKSATGTLTISVADVNDNAPLCNTVITVPALPENTKDKDIAYLNCSDVDTVGQLTYSILTGSNSSYFNISSSGVISVTAGAEINYELTWQISLQMSISDGVHTVNSFAKITVKDVNEFDPKFSPPGPFNISLKEDVSLNTILIRMNATDDDIFDTVKVFSIIDGNQESKFLIDPVTGDVRVLNSLDYETTKSYSLQLQVTDSGNRNSTAVVKIAVEDVNDNRPICNSTWVVVSVNESESNKLLFTPDCKDLDTNLDPEKRYTLVSGNASFIDFNTTTGAVYLKAAIDYEIMTSHTVVIKAFDNGLPDIGVSITLTIDVQPVNEYSPVFNPSNVYNNVSVSEDAPVGYIVFRVNATDQDKGLAQGTVRYSIIYGDPYQYFEIDETSGELKTLRQLDRETFSGYSLIIEAKDDLPGSSTAKHSNATVIISITDVNDNTPQFNSSLYLASLTEKENAKLLLTVKATDKDDPFTKDYGNVTYTIVQGGSDFTIDAVTGDIRNSHVLDADLSGKTIYTIVVAASDSRGAVGALSSTALVSVTVTTANEYKPEFSSPSYSTIINETQYKFGDTIITFSAKDNDTGKDGEFTFDFALPQTKFALVQDGKTGRIILNDNLDFEKNDTIFHFQILAADKGSPPQTGTADVTIEVNDVNDNSPSCVSIINVDRVESTSHIANLSCTDQDVNKMFTYKVVSITPPSINVSVSNDGIVTASSALDYEIGNSYQIIIQVVDSSSNIINTATVTINLRVSDLNDNPPTLTGPYNFTITESESVSNKVLYHVNASGNDGPGDYLTYSLSPSTYFAITPLSGEVTLKSSAPDFETFGPLYIFTVCVMDSPNPVPFKACQNISVTIIDVNDNRPVFNPAVYSASVPESAAKGTELSAKVMAYDGDKSPEFNQVVYNIIDGNAAGNFKINGSGVLTLAQLLDYETVTSYALVIQASDGTFTANASYFIQVQPVNEFTPTFNTSVVTYSIPENSLTNFTFYLAFNVSDGDSGNDGKFTHSIESGPFEIDPDSGLLSVIDNIDRETNQSYTLLIRATDKGAAPRTGTLTLSVTVLDVNDNAPACSQTFFTALVVEQIPQSQPIIAALRCQDRDLDPSQNNNAITYTMISNTASLFEVTSSGEIRVRSNIVFDREVNDFYAVVVEVSDLALSNKLTTTVTAEVTIADLNDNAPKFGDVLPKTIPEDLALGSSVAVVSANDSDVGINSDLVYNIVGGNTGNKFRIDQYSGAVTLESSLDYEIIKAYVLVITAYDKSQTPLTSTTSLTVSLTDVNDKPPVCPATFISTNVAENSQSIQITQVSCSDIDTVGSLAYIISSGNGDNNFRVDTMGNVYVNYGAVLDYEIKQEYLLQILVTDGPHNVTVSVKVTLTDVNEYNPVFSPLLPNSVSVKENASVGSMVLTLNATDPDIYDGIKRYSIIDGNSNQKFTIDSNMIIIFSPLDYEIEKSYTLRLMVQDSTLLNDTVSINITVEDVNDNRPVCSETSVIVSVDENANSILLYTPTCTDADKVASPVLVYSILSGSNPALSLNTSTGALSLQSGLDYEKVTSLDVVLQVSDNGSPAFSASISLRINVNPVNEFPPKFNQTSYGPYSLPENASLGAQVAVLTALDDDKGLLQGTVRYQIIAGDDQQTFFIGETTGVITVTRGLDRETKDSYSLTVRAIDDQPGSTNQKSATASVSIHVSDVNDNTPVFTTVLSFLNVSENAIAGPLVELLKLTVQDSDMDINSQTDITITSGNNDKKFFINGTSLVLIDSLDYETTNHYDLVLTVTDNGSPKLSSTCRVVIDVLPANDNTPLINVTSMTKTIPEDTAVGTLVFDADASDLDKGMQGKITYDIASGVTYNDFVINSVTGQLFVGSALDFDDGPRNYSIIVRATDEDLLAKRTATASLSIILTDVNDNAPVFSKSEYVFSIIENTVTGTIVGNFLVTDKDSGVNGQITLTLTGGNGLAYFTVNSNRDLITTANKTDFEITKVLYLSVSATDGSTPYHTSNCLVRIDVSNVNDNYPTITPSNFAVHVLENSSVGTAVQSYVATDPDTSGILFYLPNNSYFDVNPTSGLVTLKATLDREKTTNHTLNVMAIDSGTPADNSTSHTATATLLVIVDDVNDNPPEIVPGTYSKTVLETAAVNELVLTIPATDADSGVNSELVYAITAGNTYDSFKIDFAGNLMVAKPLNPDLTNHYTLIITVTDRGTPALFASTSADIVVERVNDPPVFELSSYLFNVDENSPVGRTVGTVSARDNDPGLNGLLTYSFSQASFPHFTINSATGVITVSSDKIDRETLAQYRGIVRVTDGGLPALVASAEVVIDVNDLDDNSPMFSPASYSKSIKENLPIGTSVIQVTTTDADTPANSAVVYSINTNMLNGSIAVNFFQVSTAGLVSIKALLDYETYKGFSFIVQASKPSLQLFVTASVVINIADENDNSPVFKSQFINNEVDYTKSCNDVVAQVSATDADSGDNGRLVYTLNTNTYGALFTVDSVTGDVKMSTTAAAGTKYTLVVGAYDLGVPQLSSTTTVRVDAFNPVNQIISFYLSLSKSNFQSQQQTFLTNLQAQLRSKYPKAVLKLWCVTERDGVASVPGSTRRKRQTTSKPVTVGVFALQDDSTNSLGNLGQEKQFLSQSDLLTAFSDITSGNAGAQFNNYGILSVKTFSEQDSSDGWWDTVYGPIITAILIALGLIIIAVIIYCCCRHRRRKNRSERTSSSEEPEIPPADYSPRFFKGYQGVEFYPVYPRHYPIRIRNGDPEQFMNPYFSNKHYSHL